MARRISETMKRLFDILFCLAVLPIVVPVLLLLVALIWQTMSSPIFFRQLRAGQHGKPFYIVKFRTMSDKRYSNGEMLPDSERVGRFGAFLRRSSLDELPEIWNILKGDMSLVGPRPLLLEYLKFYSKDQRVRHDVKPGLTGWAQINGRNAISWEQKFELDTWYVRNSSFILDLKIMLITLKLVCTGKGVNADGNLSMPKFGADSEKR